MDFWHRSFLIAITVFQIVPTTVCNLTADRCSSLTPSTDLSAYNATILNTTFYAAGELDAGGLQNEVSFCEVYGSVSYGDKDTSIFALWLPDEAEYASRFMAVGNGGFAGVISYTDMMFQLNGGLGLAVAGGDAGHQTNGTGLGSPGVFEPFLHDEDQVKAWLQDGISLYTPPSKELIKIFYGHQADYSYFTGCSAGGAQGFSLAQLYPDMFDGIIAGGHTNWFTRNMLSFLWNAQHTASNETTLSQPLLDFIQASVIEECDLNDGVEDNLVENPLDCDFEIDSLACESGGSAQNSTCLTPAQISAVKSVYQGPVRSDDTEVSLYPGITVGSEAGWALPIVSGALSNAFAVPILQNRVYDDLAYDPSTFNWASDVEFLDARAGPLINSINTDLSDFRNGGSKLIAFAGWADPNIAPEWSLQNAEDVTKNTLGQEVAIEDNDFLKLVMIPGGGHCGANIARYPYVPASYGFSSAIIDWVEKNKEPVEGIKSWGPTNGDDRTRRLCTWPQVAKLTEGGDVDDWESYICG